MEFSVIFMRNVFGAALIAFSVLGNTGAAAKDARVVVVAEGESYEGVPKFRLWADNRLVGEAQLGRSPDPPLGVAPQSLGETLLHYSGRFEFIVPTIEKVRFLGIGFSNNAESSEGKGGVRSLTITEIIVDGVDFDPRALSSATVASADVGQKRFALSRDGLFRLKRPDGGWSRRTAAKGSGGNEMLKKKEAARLAAAEEERKKAEAARITEEERKKAEAERIAEEEREGRGGAIAEEERKKAEARIAEEERRSGRS